ncbi:MAG: hypothetical protein IPP90_08550 [Gemmatimonadaceae bacterium]|nr:hypothetical protein [Gemmatimonadaceae bacterium]
MRTIDANAAARDLLAELASPLDRELLDRTGNGDGVYNLGDLLAHLDRTGQVLSSAISAQLLSAPSSLSQPIQLKKPPTSRR